MEWEVLQWDRKKTHNKKANTEILSDEACSQLPKKPEMPTVTYHIGLKWHLFKKNLTHNPEDCFELRSKSN